MVRQGALPEINRESLTLDERRTEILYLQLRSTGIGLSEFCSVFGEDLLLDPEVHRLIDEEMISVEGDQLKLTSQGYRFCDGIVMRLMASEHREYTPDETSSNQSSRRDYIPVATLS
jgi:coproporphyrinogen III oxidase-like Fe-S oxidoreductase